MGRLCIDVLEWFYDDLTFLSKMTERQQKVLKVCEP